MGCIPWTAGHTSRSSSGEGVDATVVTSEDLGATRPTSSAADHVLYVPCHNYGIVEDMHQASIHVITQYLEEAWAHRPGAGDGG